MNNNKRLVLFACLALIFAMAPATIMADEWDQATKLTFSEPVEVPGQVLPAGTYWFTLADNQSDRNIVQVWDADRIHLITTILAIPDYRVKPAGKTVINFDERPADQPEAIHSWFYPGATYGEEFVYPKARAAQFAKQTNRPVLSMPDTQPTAAPQIKQAPVKATTPSGEEIEIAEIVETQAVLPQAPSPASLPKTGSPIPLIGIFGLLAIAAALVLRAAARTTA